MWWRVDWIPALMEGLGGGVSPHEIFVETFIHFFALKDLQVAKTIAFNTENLAD